MIQPRFSASRFWPVALEHGCTWTSTIPFCMKALLEHEIPNNHRFRLWGTAVCEPPAFAAFGVKIIGWWGMTETITHGIIGEVDQPNTPMSIGRTATEYAIRLPGAPVRDHPSAPFTKLRVAQFPANDDREEKQEDHMPHTASRLIGPLFVALALAATIGSASAETADTVLFNGKILTVDRDFSVREAIAIARGRVLATGTTAEMKKLADDRTGLLDLGGRTVIPGLTDGHIHGIRAALTFGAEVNWIGVPTLKDALDRIHEAAKTQPPGSWIVVAGGWTEEQFAEKRRPTPQDVAEAAPQNPVYIQHLYDWLLLSPKAMEALSIHGDADVGPGGKLELDKDGKPTGFIEAGGNALGRIFDKLPKPTLAQQVEGSRTFFREMNALGITGIVDGGGVSMYPANYQAVFKLWHDRQLTLRVAYHLCAPKPGSELADLQNLTQLLPQGFGDDMLHFNGPGEILIWADWTDGDIAPDGKAKLAELLRWAASKGYTIQLHWNPDRTVHDLLDVVEDINRDYPVRELRWTVLHLYNASEDSLRRMKALGLIWGVQDGLYFGGERLQKDVGVEAAKEMPRIATAMKLGLTVAGGTDAHRVSSYNPFVALQWYLDGTTIGRVRTRENAEAPSRRQALEMYTRNSAFMANDDDTRGTLEPGKFADLAVLSADYLTAPVQDIGRIKSLLTMVGGKVVYASEPFADLAAGTSR